MRYFTVDRLLDLDPGRSARAIRNVTLTEDIFESHFPNFPVLPGVFVVDTLTQVAAWASASRYQLECRARLTAFRSAKFRHFVRPGDQLVAEVNHVRSFGDREVWSARALVSDKLIASIPELEFSIERVTASELERERQRFNWAARDLDPRPGVPHALSPGAHPGSLAGVLAARRTEP